MRPIPRRLWLGAAIVLLTACATTRGGSNGGFADDLLTSTRALEAGDYREATIRLGWLAGDCQAGPHGRRAVLLLASTALDPRNPEASPDEGARLAAAFLGLPGASAGDRAVAETLYLLALDLGAGIPASAGDDGGESPAGLPRVAPRFDHCGRPVAARPDTMVPVLPDTALATQLRQARARRDSLEARLTELEAELARIRELLQGGVPPDTTGED